ncbi:MAG: hypothetical protein JW841_11575 [Deltaproteobacteria bacterium]|nr:hypothetical protein [Deltaproteobacteria bacterium]
MGPILDKIAAEMDEQYRLHPELKIKVQEERAKQEHELFLETGDGKLFTYIEKKATAFGVKASYYCGKYGYMEFTFGDETIPRYLHIEHGIAVDYTRILDLQRPWWREALLDFYYKGKLEHIGLITPSVFEAICWYANKETATKFRLDNLLKAAGKSANGYEDEYKEAEMYAPLEAVAQQKLMKALVDFWQPIVAPDFIIDFSNGGGEFHRKVRLRPQNQTALMAMIEGKESAKAAVQKIIDNYDALVKYLQNLPN